MERLRRNRANEAYCRERAQRGQAGRSVVTGWSAGDLAREHPAAGSSLDRLGTLSLPKRLLLQGRVARVSIRPARGRARYP
jgi:hypothetical protein